MDKSILKQWHSFDKKVRPKFTVAEKRDISKQIKPISLEKIQKEYSELKKIGCAAHLQSDRTRVGNSVVDYFTFTERLETKGKYDINFYDFLQSSDLFKDKKFIQTMIEFYAAKKKKNIFIVLKEMYNICISAINIIRPIVYMEIYTKYKARKVLDFCAGWGGAIVASFVLNINSYIGVEINKNLEEPYNKLNSFLESQEKNMQTPTKIQMIFENALNVDYGSLDYDFVFTSPPYYFIQKYSHNEAYINKKKMETDFYVPLFKKTFDSLQKGGTYILNIPKEIYENVCTNLLGPANEIFFYKKSQRQNNYKETVYVWYKAL
jgi:16S rRNA G966 N2-methylase RsmD